MRPLPLRFVLVMLAGWVNRQQQEVVAYRHAENHVLREQLGGKTLRFTDAQRSRLARVAHPIGRRGLREIGTIVTPDTLLRWYRELVARKSVGSTMRGPGRPRIAAEIQGLILEMARDNPGWGYTRIRGALEKEFRRTLAGSGVRFVKLPSRSPNPNAYAERFVRSIKSECLAQIIPLGERHLRRAVRGYAEHYHHERNHQGLGNRLIYRNPNLALRESAVACRTRLGGVVCYYERAA